MDKDDDLIMVVVGNGSDDEQSDAAFRPKIQIKSEVFDQSYDDIKLDEVLETVEKYGECLDLDIGQIIKKEPDEYEDIEDLEYLEDYEDFDEEEYVPTYTKKKKNKNSTEKKELQRHAMLKPSQCYSYVAELRESNPELRDDEELLVETLASIMKMIKPPELPQDIFIINDQHTRMYECARCDHMSDTPTAAGRHYQEKHGERYLYCFACGVDFRSKTNLYKHEKRCPAMDAVIVLRARALFVGRKGRSRPFIPKHDKKKAGHKGARYPCGQSPARYPCGQCPARFHSKPALMSHRYLHEGVRPYKCHRCPAAYTSSSALTRHTAKHTDIQFICDHCKRSFKVKAALVAHMSTHQPTKRFGCSSCGKRYAQKMALRLHEDRAHRHLPPPCACQVCPKRFPRMSLLSSHMQKQHGMKMITRKMFFNTLPTMSDEQTLQQAKLIFKSAANAPPTLTYMPIEQTDQQIDQYEKPYQQTPLYEKSYDDSYQTEVHISADTKEFPLSDALLQYIEKLQNGDSNPSVKVVCIQDGEVVEIADDVGIEQGEILS